MLLLVWYSNLLCFGRASGFSSEQIELELTERILSLFFFFLSGDTVNKIPTCGVAVISNPLVCDVCAFHATVFGKKSSFRPKFSIQTSLIRTNL